MRPESHAPTLIDLFAGVGGLSLGAARAGFSVNAAVELDPIASATHAINFPNSRHLQWDIARTSGAELLDAAGMREGELDGMVGGPPCQGFSELGKRSTSDPRNSLFSHFFRLVGEVKPRFFVAENVPGILAERNANIIRDALDLVPKNYVLLPSTEVAAHLLGVPTTRTRVFFVGYDPERMEQVHGKGLFAPKPRDPITVGAALRGLPSVRCDWLTEEQGWRRVESAEEASHFAERTVGRVPPGVGSTIALERLRKANSVSGNLGTRHTSEVVKRFDKLRPGQTDPVSRAMRLAESGFCPTLRAGTGSDRGSFQALRPIHPRSPRVITPREAARLQGFPDWFQFHRTKWQSFRQIGNSVSPLVSETLLSYLRKKL